MKPVDYPNNGNGLYAQYHIMREGPSYFSIYYKNSSVLRQDPKDAWRVLGSAKFTDNSKEFKQWCLDIHEKWSEKMAKPLADKQAGVKDTSFASEAMKETGLDPAETDPTADTKMIT